MIAAGAALRRPRLTRLARRPFWQVSTGRLGPRGGPVRARVYTWVLRESAPHQV